MILHYLASVQKLLEDYDFQDKYKVMLDLEETLTKMDNEGHVDQDMLLATIGTPAQFVDEVINKYNLSPRTSTSNVTRTNSTLTNDSHNSMAGQNINPNSTNLNHQATDQDYSSNNYHNHEDLNDYDKDTKKKKNTNSTLKVVKKPFKIFFSIITLILCILAACLFSFAIIISVVFLVLVDIQTALMFLIGVLFLLNAIFLSFNFIKNIVYSIINRKFNILKLAMNLIFIVILVFLSNVMLTSAINTVNQYIANNLNTVQIMFSSRNIDINNIDWQNMNLVGYAKLVGNAIKASL